MSDTEFRLQFAQNVMLANCLTICICLLFVYGTAYGICVFNTTLLEQTEKLFAILSHITKLKSPFCFNVFIVSTEMNLTTRCLMMAIVLLYSVPTDSIFVTFIVLGTWTEQSILNWCRCEFCKHLQHDWHTNRRTNLLSS